MRKMQPDIVSVEIQVELDGCLSSTCRGLEAMIRLLMPLFLKHMVFNFGMLRNRRLGSEMHKEKHYFHVIFSL